ncbi:MAG: prepilin-type N-terminal cleavage/methylation domain-containing protein [Planctomycetaceae bacterium]
MRTTHAGPPLESGSRRSRGRSSRRRGFSLVETLVVVSLTGVLGVLAMRLLIEMQRVRNAQRQAVTSDLVRARLARAFRADVHRAIEARSDAPARLRLMMNEGGRVIYSGEDGRVSRSVEEEDRVVRRDEFRVGVASRFAVTEDGRWATWTRSRAPVDARTGVPPRPLEIAVEAAVDRHRRRANHDLRESGAPESEEEP